MSTHAQMMDEMEPTIYELKRQKSFGGVQGKVDSYTKLRNERRNDIATPEFEIEKGLET